MPPNGTARTLIERFGGCNLRGAISPHHLPLDLNSRIIIFAPRETDRLHKRSVLYLFILLNWQMDMFAVIKTGGKQIRVRKDDVVVVERVAGDAGGAIEFDNVLAIGDDKTNTIGTPLIEGAGVRATIVEQRQGDKVIVFKKQRRKNYRRRIGHRQLETVIRVDEIVAKGFKKGDAKPAKPTAKTETKTESKAEAAPVKDAAKPAAKKAAKSTAKKTAKKASSTKKAPVKKAAAKKTTTKKKTAAGKTAAKSRTAPKTKK